MSRELLGLGLGDMSIWGLVTGEMSFVLLLVSIAHVVTTQRSREGLSSGYEELVQ